MNICLVSNEILGAYRNGGIGTATSNLAVLFGESGHSVTLFYVGTDPLDTLDRWAAIYHAAKINVVHYPGSQARINPSYMKQPVEIYEQLSRGEFDLIIFQDWKALGHGCVVAKRAGLAFSKTILATITHSNSHWILEANQSFPNCPEHLALEHMEKQAVELSDAVVSPSTYLVNWMSERGWQLPSKTDVIPLFLEGPELLGATPPSVSMTRRRIHKPSHLIFFGRFEERKGISIFLSALTSEELRGFKFKLTFLGKPASKSVDDIRAFIGDARPDLLEELEILPDLSSDEAQEYLSRVEGVAVMPSLIDNSPCCIYEVLKLGLPFVASSCGGVPELVHADDSERCLFAPNASALAISLKAVLSADYWDAPRPARNSQDILNRWIAWLNENKPSITAASPPNISKKDTTVVITHYERPRLLEQNLRALSLQSDNDFDVVLVDDGSRCEKVQDYLDRLEKGFGCLSMRVIRKQNGYVGAARNEGLRCVETPYVILLDDDNIPFPNMVEVFRCAAHASGADILTCQMQLFHDALNEPDPWELIAGERLAFPGGPIALGLVDNCFGDATAIYRRSVFEQYGGFHEIHGVTHEDWQMYLRACLQGCRLLSLPVPLFWYRVAPTSMVRSTAKYSNIQVIASVFRDAVDPNIARIFDFILGTVQR